MKHTVINNQKYSVNKGFFELSTLFHSCGKLIILKCEFHVEISSWKHTDHAE